MQVSRFIGGGYVIHKIRLTGLSWYSAWYDGDGKLIDAERRHGQISASIPAKHTKTWEALRKIGLRYKHIPMPLNDGI